MAATCFSALYRVRAWATFILHYANELPRLSWNLTKWTKTKERVENRKKTATFALHRTRLCIQSLCDARWTEISRTMRAHQFSIEYVHPGRIWIFDCMYFISNKPITFSTILLFTNFCVLLLFSNVHMYDRRRRPRRRTRRDRVSENNGEDGSTQKIPPEHKLYGRFVVRKRAHYRVTESSGSIPLFSSVCTAAHTETNRNDG